MVKILTIKAALFRSIQINQFAVSLIQTLQAILMRMPLTILSLLVTTSVFSQFLSDKYLHFQTDYYWDTTLYKSDQVYFYEVTNGRITQKVYPVLQYLFTKIISDTPWITKDTFQRRDRSDYPYKYIRKGNSIYLQYFDLRKRKLQLHKEYSLDHRDTVNWLANKKSLDSKYGISVGGFSTYLGEETIQINGKPFNTFHFLEDHDESGSHPSYYTIDVFLDKTTLIPIKYIQTNYDYITRQRLLYNSITMLATSGNTLPDYTNKRVEDLVIYENKSTTWTERQKQEFFKKYPADMKQYVDCLIRKLDGHISFFHFEQSMRYMRVNVSKECE